MPDLNDVPKRVARCRLDAKAPGKGRASETSNSQRLDLLSKAEVNERLRSDWLKANQRSVATYNRRVAREGVFSDNIRDY